MTKALGNKTVKFSKPKVDEEVSPHNYPPTLTLNLDQLGVLKGKDIGGECNFKIKTELKGIDKGEKETRYSFEVTEMQYIGKEESDDEEEKEPIRKAYTKATKEDEYVKLRTEPSS